MPRLLIVDDEAYISTQLEEHLTFMGYTVVGTVSSGQASINMAKSLHPDLVLMDIVMPGKLDGIDAAEIITKKYDIPVIFLTAYADDKFIMRAKKVGPYGYILKPFHENEIKAAIEVALHKRKMEQHLREGEKRFRSLFESASKFVHILDNHGKIIQTNPATIKHSGYNETELVGQRLAEFLTPASKKIFREKFPVPLKKGASHQELEFVYKDGTIATMACFFSRIRAEPEESARYLCLQCDITERKRRERELEKTYEQLRQLARHLESVREQERTLMALEIQDDLGQRLTALKMDISWLGKRLAKHQESLLEKTRSMSELTDMTINRVNKISTELRPSLLDDLGLSAAIEWQTEEFENRTGIRSKLTVDPEDITMDKIRSTPIFRIFQETLTNVARHAQATKVTVSFKEKAHKWVLRVRDNGKGITEEQICDPKSFGLMGIRECVHPWGGEVKIKGTPDKGTTVTVSIPVDT
jgi:PAS domain S-box-containing protein